MIPTIAVETAPHVPQVDALEGATRETVLQAFGAYVECAVWSSTDDDGEPLDARFEVSDISAGSLVNMLEDVLAFLEGVWQDDRDLDLSALEPEQIGHDFWLTRNHHGAGFWDRGLGELGDILTELAHPYGEAYLWPAEDGRLYYAT